MSPPGPWIPAPLQALLYLRAPGAFLERCRRRFGDVFVMRVPMTGAVVLVAAPEEVRRIFTGDPAVVLGGAANDILAPLLGTRSVMLLDGADHRRQRRLLTPPFQSERMAAWTPTIQAAVDQEVARLPVGRPFVLHPHMQRLTLEVLLRVVFGVDDAQDGASVRALCDALETLLSHQEPGLRSLWMVPALQRSLLGLSPWVSFQRDRQAADDLLYARIDRRRRELAAGAPARADVLDGLLAARDEAGAPMSAQEIHDALITLLIAGHETTATMLCWAFDLILGDARVHARLLAEIRGADGPGATLPYLEATLKEVLRLRPVIPAPGRRLAAPMTVGGHALAAGTMVLPTAYLTHRDPEHFPEPDAFQPERFLGGKKHDPHAWFPFGGGPRRCLGASFAMHEMKIVVAALLDRVRLRKVDARPAPMVLRGFTLAPGRGAEVIVDAGPA
jgi:cytochrome P450